MTVIAWDGTTLAADRRACASGYVYSVTKIARVGDHLVAFSGAFARWGQYRAWIEAGRHPAAYPDRPTDDDEWCSVVVISRGGLIERYETTGWPIVVEERHYAAGSGRDFAAAALHLGYDAVRAVEVASALSEQCGNGIDTLTFGEPVT